jgi:hypothetical protein
MPIESLSALVYSSKQPTRLAEFYRLHLGIPFATHDHGPVREHLEATVAGTHFAVLPHDDPSKERGTGVAPTFRVRGLEAFAEDLRKQGVAPLHAVLELGEGRRVVSFRDPDENVFRLIDFGS